MDSHENHDPSRVVFGCTKCWAYANALADLEEQEREDRLEGLVSWSDDRDHRDAMDAAADERRALARGEFEP